MKDCYCTNKLIMGKKGVITLSASMKEALNVSPGDYLEMFIEGDTIILRARETASHYNFLKEYQAQVK